MKHMFVIAVVPLLFVACGQNTMITLNPEYGNTTMHDRSLMIYIVPNTVHVENPGGKLRLLGQHKGKSDLVWPRRIPGCPFKIYSPAPLILC